MWAQAARCQFEEEVQILRTGRGAWDCFADSLSYRREKEENMERKMWMEEANIFYSWGEKILHNKEGRNSAYTNIILLSSSCLKEKHHRSVIVCRNLDSHNFWQLFRSLKKEEVGGICILWGFPPFLSLLHSYRRSAKSGHGTRVHFLYPSRQSMRIMCSN